MPKILKSYSENVIPLEDWTDDMLATLPGWSGWMYDTNVKYMWYDANSSNVYLPIGYPATPVQAGGCAILWTLSIYPVYTAAQQNSMPLIAGRPYVLYNGFYYIKGDLQSPSSYSDYHSIARFSSLP